MNRRNVMAMGFAAAMAFGIAPQAAAQDEAAFYKGKTVRIIVGFSAGGGYDAYARMLAPYLAKRLDATVIVENQPGAGSMTAMNNLNMAEPDGLRLMLANGTAAALSQIMGSPAVRFDLNTMTNFGTVSASPWVWLVHKDSPEKQPQDFIKSGRLLNWSATGPTDGLSDGAQVLVVTHSPQVAARGHAHWKVMKADRDGLTATTVVALDDARRREEIARMLSGAEITDAARAAAEALIG
jgi:tripartite-type tricarboxylate transporter receptor subunit TctC